MEASHQPELLRELRQKTLSLQLKIDKLTETKKQNSRICASMQEGVQKMKNQREVQERKYRSLIVLLNELQQAYQQAYLDSKQTSVTDEVILSLENSFLRFLLIRESEHIKDQQKLLSLLKQVQLDRNRNKAKEFIKKSNFIEGQAQLIAKLKSQVNRFKNENLQCKRKWYSLQEESKALQNNKKLLAIQTQRQKTELKAQYEEYLERINQAKMKIVNFNEIQKQSILTDYLVKEMAVLQQKRASIEDQNNNLKYHYENLKEELERIQVENRELNSFFSDSKEGGLAMKMRKRIDELRDNLIEAKKKSKNTRGDKLGKILQHLRKQERNLVQGNDFLSMRVREQENVGACLDEKPIAQFFTKILGEKDKQLVFLNEEENGLYEKKKELQIQKNLLQNQIQSMEENISDNNWEAQFKEKQIWAKQSVIPKKSQWAVSVQIPEERDWNREWKKVTNETDKVFRFLEESKQ